MSEHTKISILGCGNIGLSIAKGLLASKTFLPENILATKRSLSDVEELQKLKLTILHDNLLACQKSDTIIICVTPNQLPSLLTDLKEIDFSSKTLISVVSGVTSAYFYEKLGHELPLVRAMPNTASAFLESMTCLSASSDKSSSLEKAQALFKQLGTTLVIDESQMESSTALGACGIAFFLRAIRAASQGGIEIGFHSKEALEIATQTAKGAATLLKNHPNHPEAEIDRVTTPQGATIAGLNEMEHQGLSSALIKGIITSAKKISDIFKG
ncbi:MAG: pyrroline-5-carboxylate reductase [Zetaproteobacteria bacterium]|nr:pyrroline-5-carboxylate reductase [Pseudobdellovibrionaceae bacterium]